MDLVAGRVLYGRLPCGYTIKPSTGFRLLPSSFPAGTAAAAFPGCPCPPIARRNAPAVVPFAKKERKGYSDEPPDEEPAGDLVDEMEDEEVEQEEDFVDDDGDGNGFFESRYGSPTIDDIEAYTIAYRAKLDDAESAGRIPKNISLEVSSPGVERVVRIPEELERFKERAMYVRYTTTSDETATPQEGDEVLRLISYDMDLRECTWGIADVKINRQQAGKGRPLNKK